MIIEYISGTAGLTPDAVGELLKTYKEFELNGCIGIGINVSDYMKTFITNRLCKQIKLPTMVSNDLVELMTFIEQNNS